MGFLPRGISPSQWHMWPQLQGLTRSDEALRQISELPVPRRVILEPPRQDEAADTADAQDYARELEPATPATKRRRGARTCECLCSCIVANSCNLVQHFKK